MPFTQVSRKDGKKRRLARKTCWEMCTWAHYSFRQQLLHAAEVRPWCRVAVETAAWTSKTRGACGKLQHKLGSAKTFRCPPCQYVADRDFNAAMNILLRYLTVAAVRC